MAIHLSGLPGKRPFSGTGRAARLPRLALLRVGFTEPAGSPPSLVRSYRTFSPLPVRTRHPGPAIGGLFSVALSCESPRLASPAPCSAESRPSSTRSRLAPVRAATTRPTHRRIQSATGKDGWGHRTLEGRPSRCGGCAYESAHIAGPAQGVGNVAGSATSVFCLGFVALSRRCPPAFRSRGAGCAGSGTGPPADGCRGAGRRPLHRRALRRGRGGVGPVVPPAEAPVGAGGDPEPVGPQQVGTSVSRPGGPRGGCGARRRRRPGPEPWRRAGVEGQVLAHVVGPAPALAGKGGDRAGGRDGRRVARGRSTCTGHEAS